METIEQIESESHKKDRIWKEVKKLVGSKKILLVFKSDKYTTTTYEEGWTDSERARMALDSVSEFIYKHNK